MRNRVRSHTNGKCVDTWIFETVMGEKVEVKLMLQKKQSAPENTVDGKSHQPPFPTTGCSFFVELQNPHRIVHGTDCEAIRAEVFELLDERYKIEWEEWISFAVEDVRFYSRDHGAGFQISYEYVEKGITPEGLEVMRERDRNFRYHISPWKDYIVKQKAGNRTMIRATDENIANIEAFEKKIKALREAIDSFMTPETAESALQRIAQNSLGMKELPSVEQDDKTKKRRRP